jgi:hypothetical protein
MTTSAMTATIMILFFVIFITLPPLCKLRFDLPRAYGTTVFGKLPQTFVFAFVPVFLHGIPDSLWNSLNGFQPACTRNVRFYIATKPELCWCVRWCPV